MPNEGNTITGIEKKVNRGRQTNEVARLKSTVSQYLHFTPAYNTYLNSPPDSLPSSQLPRSSTSVAAHPAQTTILATHLVPS